MATTAHCPEICHTGNNKNTLKLFFIMLTKRLVTEIV